jgi:hypothetical protein
MLITFTLSFFFGSSIPLSNQHEKQRYGTRAAGLDASKRVNKAVFMNQIMEKQHAYHQHMPEPV